LRTGKQLSALEQLRPDASGTAENAPGIEMLEPLDTITDRPLILAQLRLEAGHLTDRIRVEQRLETSLETRQALLAQRGQHGALFISRFDRGVDVTGVLWMKVSIVWTAFSPLCEK
jgi:hypothetical protein